MSAQPSYALDNWTKPPCAKVIRKPHQVGRPRFVEDKPRHCETCGAVLVRHESPGRVENLANFLDRRYCDRSCAGIGNARQRWEDAGCQVITPKRDRRSLEVILRKTQTPGNAAWRENVLLARLDLRKFGKRIDAWRFSRIVWEEAERLEAM